MSRLPVLLIALSSVGCVRFDLILRNTSDTTGDRPIVVERAEVYSEAKGCMGEDVLGGQLPPGETWTGERLKGHAGINDGTDLCVFTDQGNHIPTSGLGGMNGCTLDVEVWYDEDQLPGEEIRGSRRAYDCPDRPNTDLDDVPPPFLF